MEQYANDKGSGQGQRGKAPLSWNTSSFWTEATISLLFNIWRCKRDKIIFPDFSKKYFSMTFPWPYKFPDFFQFSLTYRNPALKTEKKNQKIDKALMLEAFTDAIRDTAHSTFSIIFWIQDYMNFYSTDLPSSIQKWVNRV